MSGILLGFMDTRMNIIKYLLSKGVRGYENRHVNIWEVTSCIIEVCAMTIEEKALYSA